jgi:hypothetical protein
MRKESLSTVLKATSLGSWKAHHFEDLLRARIESITARPSPRRRNPSLKRIVRRKKTSSFEESRLYLLNSEFLLSRIGGPKRR